MRSLVLALALATFSAPALAQVTAGKLLIKLEDAAKTDADADARLAALPCAKDLGLRFERRSVLGWVVARVDARDEAATEAALARVRGEKGVLAVDRLRLRRALRVPNDELVGELWGFAGIGADIAWDTTVGLPTQRIGVVDTGINRDHIDLIAKDQRGFDFISDAEIAEDGNGRDADYSDVSPGAGFHGSHVAGTIAASADDGIGVPGLNWNAMLVTGRALGGIGGLNSDIVEASAWMAGFDVPGVPGVGADRVSVINLSLGADDSCSAFEEDVFGAIIGAGVAVVAASGNTSNSTPTGSPASCPGVIAVGAAGPTLELASYSNFDDRIDVVAPGGDGSSFDDPTESILSIDGSSDFGYVAFDGTSMASPHVAGVVSLMQAVNPHLSPRQIRSILSSSPFTCGGFTCSDKSFLDAPDALARALATDGELDDAPPPPSGGGAGCPANSSPSPDGDSCFCNAGFVPNAAATACVPEGNGDNNNIGCPVNSTISDDGETCFCDPGFVVDAAGTGCTRDEGGRNDKDDRDEDEDDDDRRASSFSGCSSTGPSMSIGGLLALLAFARRRPRRSGRAMRPVAALALVGSLGGMGCAHAVRIESAPGAEILVNGKSVGTAPVTYNETTGSSDSVQVTARLNGREKTVTVQRSDVDMAPIGAGAGIGAATCGTGFAVTLVTAFVFLPCAAVTGAASWGALAAAPAVSWLFFSYKMPDVVKVDLGEPPRVAAAAEAVEPRSAGY